MKLILVVLAVIVLGLAGLLLYTDKSEAPTVADEAVMTDDTTDTTDSSMEMNDEMDDMDMGDDMSDDMDMSDDDTSGQTMAEMMGVTEEELAAMSAEEHDAVMDKMDGVAVFDVSGVNYAFTPARLTVYQGDEVTVNFKSIQGFHDFVVDEFEGAVTPQVNPEDGTVSVTFTADQVGEFEYYCSVGNHRQRGMVGTLVVEE